MRAEDDRAGYVAVDALVALAILSTVLALSIQLVASAWKTSRTAAELRAAQTMLRWSSANGPQSALNAAGGGFRAVQTIDRTRVGDLELCHRSTTLRADNSRRTYRQSTRTVCPEAEPTIP